MGQHVRISKDKAKFARSAEQIYRQVFRNIKVIYRTPRPVYELEDLNKKLIDGQFYEEELTPVRFDNQTPFQMDKIVATKVRRGIKEHLVKWKVYNSDFNSWVKAWDFKKI